MDINAFEKLLEMRRAAKDAEEKAIIDNVIQRLLDERPVYHSSPGDVFPKPPYV